MASINPYWHTNTGNNNSAPSDSTIRVNKNVNTNIRFMCLKFSISKIWPASSCVVRPIFKKSENIVNVMVITPSPPIWMSIRIIRCPMRVKLSSGTVDNPVTHVIDDETKNMSIKFMYVFWHIGRDSNAAPSSIVRNIAINSTLPGYVLENFFTFLFIHTFKYICSKIGDSNAFLFSSVSVSHSDAIVVFAIKIISYTKRCSDFILSSVSFTN